jgi:excisionase family DNA binding protein
MTSLLRHDNVLSSDPAEREDLQLLSTVIEQIADADQTPITKLVGPDGTQVELPASAFHALQAIVHDLANGKTVTLFPNDRELTTKEAADVLQVSRQFLVRLLDRGEIPFHKVGTHRRIRVDDLLAYKDRRAEMRKSKLDELTHLSQDDEGGYR